MLMHNKCTYLLLTVFKCYKMWIIKLLKIMAVVGNCGVVYLLVIH